ncbi:MAG: hypothetical protein JRI55_33495, partial [Deltaproteobacteria bacterium]|nr:hypothetical protein [Deltaproteobacteria bacterium]
MTTSLSYLAERGKPIGPWNLVARVDQDMAAALWLAHHDGEVAYVRSLRCRSLKTSERLERVVAQAKPVTHEGIVPLQELLPFVGGGGFAAVSRYEEGQPLASVLAKSNLARKAVPLPVAASIAIDLLDALYAGFGRLAPVWARGGLRPECVLLTRGGRARIMELGATAVVGSVDPLGSDTRWLAYASPEQIATGQPSPTSDVFTVGALLWESFTNRSLFGGRDVAEVRHKLLEGDIERVDLRARGHVPPALAAAVARALEREPNDRFDTTLAFAEAIRGSCGAVASRREVSAYLEQLHVTALNNRRRELEAALGKPAPASIPPPPGGASAGRAVRSVLGKASMARLGSVPPPGGAKPASTSARPAPAKSKLKYAPRTSTQPRRPREPAPYKPKLGVATPLKGSLPPPRPDPLMNPVTLQARVAAQRAAEAEAQAAAQTGDGAA